MIESVAGSLVYRSAGIFSPLSRPTESYIFEQYEKGYHLYGYFIYVFLCEISLMLIGYLQALSAP